MTQPGFDPDGNSPFWRFVKYLAIAAVLFMVLSFLAWIAIS